MLLKRAKSDVVWAESATSPDLELTVFVCHEDGTEDQWALVGGELVHRRISYDLLEDARHTVERVLERPSKRVLEKVRRGLSRGHLDPFEAMEDLLLPVPY